MRLRLARSLTRAVVMSEIEAKQAEVAALEVQLVAVQKQAADAAETLRQAKATEALLQGQVSNLKFQVRFSIYNA